MRAIGFEQPGDIDRDTALVDIELPIPTPTGRDILVEVKAVSVNPVDVKVRRSVQPKSSQWKVLGWDAAGVVSAVGSDVTLFKPGDAVFYAGAISRPGTNAEYHLVDERIVGMKPKTLDWAAAAALPLTSLTAWEMMFDRLDIQKAVPGAAKAIVIIGGAGGVGSIAIQMARQLTDLTVIATASRPETVAWAQKMGAHHIIDHSLPIAEEIVKLEIGMPAFVFSTTQTDLHLDAIAQLIAPQGRWGLIDDPATLDIIKFKRKSVSVHWELMFTRSIFNTSDIAEQRKILNEVSRLVDEGVLKTTMTERYSPINATNLKQVHTLIESGKARGKIVLEGFGN
ncbi:zinc-binding alcohol dehydrogenase family protein [Chamaesiphon sp. GL140_3_metabinner_50]|uniref:zinc-binding alcohol dehydrogenase family protein n=1 Tax=Chamaesiphon sp. GL140_3_metabinner_50 TaxID=2970812 RepID=UPI0025CC2A2A|nr:zinc-binding alcohol dehydrogenase family protein [Chamaesiphon sp. GL140_3_metabinner_50]